MKKFENEFVEKKMRKQQRKGILICTEKNLNAVINLHDF